MTPEIAAHPSSVATVASPGDGGVGQAARRKEPTLCPQCVNFADHYGRCLQCFDWVCLCGEMTGSFYFSQCARCSAEVDRRKILVAAWAKRIQGVRNDEGRNSGQEHGAA